MSGGYIPGNNYGDNVGIDDEFFSESNFKSNFICNIGYGDHDKLFDRSPRFDFDEVCKIL